VDANTKQQSVFREVAIYTLWLLIGAAAVILLVFLFTYLVFRSKVVANEAMIMLVAVIWIVTHIRLRKNGMNYSDIWLKLTPRFLVKLTLGFNIGAVFIVIIFITLWATKLITFQPNTVTGLLIMVLLANLVFTLIQSGVEELVFRGYLLKVLAGKGRYFAIMITSTVFSVLHFHHGFNPVGWLNIFFFGVVMAQMVFTWKNLWLPWGFHAGWNFFQTDIFSFPVYGRARMELLEMNPVTGRDIITGGSYGPEGSLLTTVLLLIFIIILYSLPTIKCKFGGSFGDSGKKGDLLLERGDGYGDKKWFHRNCSQYHQCICLCLTDRSYKFYIWY